MAGRSTNPESGGGPAPDRASSTTTPPRTPRWVKALAIIGIVVVVLIVIALATGLGGPGDHGPGRHLPSGDAGRYAALEAAAGGHAQLADAPIVRTTIADAADGPAQLTDGPLGRVALAGDTEPGLRHA